MAWPSRTSLTGYRVAGVIVQGQGFVKKSYRVRQSVEKGDYQVGKGRWEYLRRIYERYQKAGRKAKKASLDEFCENIGYYRKDSIRLLSGPPPESGRQRFLFIERGAVQPASRNGSKSEELNRTRSGLPSDRVIDRGRHRPGDPRSAIPGV